MLSHRALSWHLPPALSVIRFDYVIYNYNHNAVPKETLERVLACYQLSIEDVSDKIVEHSDDGDDDLDDLIGGLDD